MASDSPADDDDGMMSGDVQQQAGMKPAANADARVPSRDGPRPPDPRGASAAIPAGPADPHTTDAVHMGATADDEYEPL